MAERAERGLVFRTSDRLHRPAEFSAVMADSARMSGGCFELRFRRVQRAATDANWLVVRPQLGLIIPKRFAKRAVLRNLLKRLAREAFRHAKSGLPPVSIVLRLVKTPLTGGCAVDATQRREWRRILDDLLARVPR